MAQPFKCLTLDFGSGHELAAGEIQVHIRLWADGMEPAWDSLSLSLKKINIKKKEKKRNEKKKEE